MASCMQMDSVYSHAGTPLEQGALDGYTLICPWHHGKLLISALLTETNYGLDNIK